jgi:hypothetical protein
MLHCSKIVVYLIHSLIFGALELFCRIYQKHTLKETNISYAVLAESGSEKRANYSNMTMLMMTLLITKI